MKNLATIVAGILLLSACSKSEVVEPQFDISFENKNYKAGDTVVFNFEGNAENMILYPGTPGADYEKRDRVEEQGTPILNFTSTLNNAGQVNTLKLLASTDFNGRYTQQDVAAASWVDITSRAQLATSATARASGNIDLSDFLTVENKPLYLAFRYLGYQHATLKQPKWALTVFAVNNRLADGSLMPITIAAETGWGKIDFKNVTTQWSTPATGLISIDGTTVVAGAEKLNEDNDDWAISKPLNLKRVNPDKGIVLKHLSASKVESYSYVFPEAGTYKVVCVGFNTNEGSRKEVIKELTITINPAN